MAPPSLRHPMERLICERDMVHDASEMTRINENPPPPNYHLYSHFLPPTHRPLYYPELVRLRNVIAFRDGTASSRKSDVYKIPPEEKASTKFFVEEVREATNLLDSNMGYPDRFVDANKKRLDMYFESEETKKYPCTGRCCSEEPPLSLDRVIYRYMGEARPNIFMLEAVHFELFLPDRFDLRYFQVTKKVVDKYSLKEGMLVWISSTSLSCVPIRSRTKFRDVHDMIPYFISWRVNDIIHIVCSYEQTWTVPFRVAATVCDFGKECVQQSVYMAGVCSQFPFPVYGRASLFDSRLKPGEVPSATITKREASWLYSVEPIRNLPLYQKVVDNIDSSNMQSGYRVDEFSTEKHEHDFYNEGHKEWFRQNKLDSESFVWMMERSLSIGTVMARSDSRDKDFIGFGEFSGFITLSPTPRLLLYPCHETLPMHKRYANLYFNTTVSTKMFVVSIVSWHHKDNFRIAYCRPSFALEELKMKRGFSDKTDVQCNIRFSDTPSNALDYVLRFDLDNPGCVKLPAVIGDLYGVMLPFEEGASVIPKRSRRILVSQMGRKVAKEKCIRFSVAHPTTSFAVIGEERSGKTLTAAAITLATPRRYNKLLLTTTRKDARYAWDWLISLFYSDEECKKCEGNEVDETMIPKNKMPLETKYEDSLIEEKEEESKEFLTWPIGDIVLATIDSVLQIVHHHHKDKEDPLIPFLRSIHTIIIDNADTVTEAYFYGLVKAIHPSRVIVIGNHEKAEAIAAERTFHMQAHKPILHGIVSYIRPHSLPILQIKRSPEKEKMRASFYVRAPIEDSLMDGLLKYSQGAQVEKMGAVLDFLGQCRVPTKKVVVLTMDEMHQESMKFICADYDPELEIHQFDDFVGHVRPVVIILGGWYARRYWHEQTFLDLYSTLYLDMLIFIGFNNVLKLDNWCELSARRCLVQRKLCEFPNKKK